MANALNPVNIENLSESVTCPAADYEKHYRWCYANRADTTDDYSAKIGHVNYCRIFRDKEVAKFFRFDFGIRS